MTSANKNAFDWHCEDHDTYGWRGDECRMCPEAPSEASRLRAEVKILQAQNAALLVAIEAKDAALKKAVDYLCQPCAATQADEDSVLGLADEALALSPSTELLEARDRKRDAKLLRVIANSGALSTEGVKYVFQQANARADGSWKPELGD